MIAAVVGGIALVGGTASASIWNVFRRRVPYLSQDDLLEDPMNDLQVVRKIEPV